MEVTTNLPIEQWYKNGTDNNLMYWGLDYPPLTAYHMYALGYVSKNFINSSWTELHASRGIESYHHKLFMRGSVIIADITIYITAILYYFIETPASFELSPPTKFHRLNRVIYSALVLLYPAQILIDHGHFQYNCVFMGLTLWAVIMMLKDRHVAASILYMSAICYKQMALYYSLPFFWYIVSYNLRVRPFWKGIRNIIFIGIIVISVFGLISSPFILSNALFDVLKRCFPVSRGLFEDKVANIWFSVSLFYKYRRLYSIEDLIKASTLATLFATLPTGLRLLFKPTQANFKYALVNSSLAFFLLSFQVHEKTILVPALPILLLYREHPIAVNWFALVSTFSLQPLLLKDGQIIPYTVLTLIYLIASIEVFNSSLKLKFDNVFSLHNLSIAAYISSVTCCILLGASALLVKPPDKYPDIHQAVNALYSCLHFVSFWLFFQYQQFSARKSLPVDRVFLVKKNK